MVERDRLSARRLRFEVSLIGEWLKDLWKETWARWLFLIGLGSNIITFFFPGLRLLVLRQVALVLLAAGFLWANFGVYKRLRSEIAKLRIRPYDVDVQELVRGKLARLGSDERDVLRYLVRFGGEREQGRIYAEAGINAAEFGAILMQVDGTGLLNRAERQKPGRAGTELFWWVNPQFVEVLKDELFPRPEKPPQRLFLSH